MGTLRGRNLNCVFCKILENSNTVTDSNKVLKSNERLAVIADIRPASKHHYLVIPKSHVEDTKSLKSSDDINLVKEMHEFGKDYLKSVATPEEFEEGLFGFHLPPFVSVKHLHLHIIAPSTSMSFINSFLFWKNAWYFVSPETLVCRLIEK